MTKKNKTTITAEPGKQELFITREFDAPAKWFPATQLENST